MSWEIMPVSCGEVSSFSCALPHEEGHKGVPLTCPEEIKYG